MFFATLFDFLVYFLFFISILLLNNLNTVSKMLTLIRLFLKVLPIAILVAYLPKSIIPADLMNYHDKLTNYILPITDPFVDPILNSIKSSAVDGVANEIKK